MRLCARIGLLLPLCLLATEVLAWQLTQKSLSDRVDAASVVVIAKIAAIHSRSMSLIHGVGETWDVTLRVIRVLKGAPPLPLRATVVEVAVRDWPSLGLNDAQIWLLSESGDPEWLITPSTFESVLPAHEEASVLDILGRGRHAADSR